MRRFGLQAAVCGRGYAATYQCTLRTHDDVLRSFVPENVGELKCSQGSDLAEKVEPLLDHVEAHIASWRQQKWDLRTPPLLSAAESQEVRRQLDVLRTTYAARTVSRRVTAQALHEVAALTGLEPSEVKYQTTAWAQDHISKLRWQGDVEKAKRLREGWERIQSSGCPSSELLERMCSAYSLARIGTFDNAFQNTVVRDEQGVRLSNEQDPFSRLIGAALVNVPTLPILHDFLGFASATAQGSAVEGVGYRQSLGHYLAKSVQWQLGDHCKSEGNVLVAGEGKNGRVILSILPGDSIGDYLFVHGTDITVISIGKMNKFLRSSQIPPTRQLQGICRRFALVTGMDVSKVRCRHLMLPPCFLDRNSLDRLHRVVDINSDSSNPDLVERVCPRDCIGWVRRYAKQLSSDDVDFAAQTSKQPEEEWVVV